MATTSMVVNVVDVGQGQCTFVEIYDSSKPEPLVETLLFDCGSDSKTPVLKQNLDYIAAKVNSMAVPKFDAVFFSHSDSDHVSLMIELLNRFLPAKPPIDLIWFGGSKSRYKKGKVNVLTYLVTAGYCLLGNIKALGDNESQVDVTAGTFKDPPLWKNGDDKVRVHLLAGNVLANDPVVKDTPTKKVRGTPEFLNRVSLICVVRYETKDYFICGDATNATMATANYYAQNATFNNTVMLTLPHHGSRATGLNVGKKQAAKPWYILLVEKFSKIIKGKTLTVSAYKQHHHPSLELIELFTPNAEAKSVVKDQNLVGDSHYVVVNIDRALKKPDNKTIQKNYSTFGTDSNLYATYCYKTTPTYSFPTIAAATVTMSAPVVTIPAVPNSPAFNANASWVYTTLAGGGTKMFGASSLPADGASPNPNIFTEDVAGGGVLLSQTGSTAHGIDRKILSELSPPVYFRFAPMRAPAASSRPRMIAGIKTFR